MALDVTTTIELLDIGVSSQASSVFSVTRSLTRIDTSKYDGATYYFEVVAYNSSGGPLTVDLMYYYPHDADAAWYVAGSVSVSASTTVTRYRSSAITLSSARNYRLRLPSTDANALRIHAARVIVVQSSATKTRCVVPLLQTATSGYTNADDSSASLITQMSDGWTGGNYGTYWKYDAANMVADTIALELEVVVGTEADGTGSVCLYDLDADSAVTDATFVFNYNTTATNLRKQFTTAALTDGHTYAVRLKGDGSHTSYMSKAALNIDYTYPTKIEVYHRIGGQQSAGTSPASIHYQRHRIDMDGFGDGTVACYFETTGYSANTTLTYWLALSAADSTSARDTNAPYDDYIITRSGAVMLSDGDTTRRRKRMAAFTTIGYSGYDFWVVRPYEGVTLANNAALTVAFIVAVVATSQAPTAPVLSASQLGTDIKVTWT